MVHGAALASIGHRVTGVCGSPEIAAALNAAKPVVYERGLAKLMRQALREGRLRYTCNYGEGLKGAAFAYLSIDTPVGEDDSSNLDGIFEATREVGRHRDGDLVLCVSAQVPVGTCARLLGTMREAGGTGRSAVAYVPEFLRLGTALQTFRKADRFVVGADDPKVARKVAALYAPLKRPVFLTDLRTAEMAKHASNAFLATSISFINEIADLSDRVGADACAVAQVLKADRRIGPHAFLSPGLGYAGGTLGREIRALQKLGRELGVTTDMMDAVDRVNGRRAQLVGVRLDRALGGLNGRRVAMLGLTYKPGTSTMRRAISLAIIRDLVQRGATVTAFDPLADLHEVDDLPPFEPYSTVYDACRGADAVVLATEWRGLERLDIGTLRKVMKGHVVMDTRNYFDPLKLKTSGFTYLGIGRSVADSESSA